MTLFRFGTGDFFEWVTDIEYLPTGELMVAGMMIAGYGLQDAVVYILNPNNSIKS